MRGLIARRLYLLSYLFGASTALRSWPAPGVSETAHGLVPSSASPLSINGLDTGG